MKIPLSPLQAVFILQACVHHQRTGSLRSLHSIFAIYTYIYIHIHTVCYVCEWPKWNWYFCQYLIMMHCSCVEVWEKLKAASAMAYTCLKQRTIKHPKHFLGGQKFTAVWGVFAWCGLWSLERKQLEFFKFCKNISCLSLQEASSVLNSNSREFQLFNPSGGCHLKRLLTHHNYSYYSSREPSCEKSHWSLPPKLLLETTVRPDARSEWGFKFLGRELDTAL